MQLGTGIVGGPQGVATCDTAIILDQRKSSMISSNIANPVVAILVSLV